MYELAKSQHGFAISKLLPNQALIEMFGAADLFNVAQKTIFVVTFGNENVSTANLQNQPIVLAVLPSNVKKIDDTSFLGDTNLKEVQLNPATEEVGHEAFTECTALEKINLENVKEIGNVAFAGCGALKQINLAKAIVINAEAFAGCTNAKITLNDNVEEVGNDAFVGCLHLTYHGNLPGAPWGALGWN